MHRIERRPLPQVGALLDLDSALELHDEIFKKGCKHWQLNGSCILMAPDKILVISHALEKQSRMAAFFPYAGLFELTKESDEKGEIGDPLVVVKLARSVECVKPLTWRRKKKPRKGHKQIVCGFGTWPNQLFSFGDSNQTIDGNELEGLQVRQEIVLTNRPDTLDLGWKTSENKGLIAGFGNSGGAVLKHGRVSGVNRELKKDLNVSSWISDTRKEFLADTCGVEEWKIERKVKCVDKLIPIDQAGAAWSIDVPEGARKVQATLSSGRGMRLQMCISKGSDLNAAEELETTRAKAKFAGRFLYREESLEEGTKEVLLTIAPYVRAWRYRDQVLAQVCVLFTF